MKMNKNIHLAYLLALAFITPSLSLAENVTLFSHGIADKWKQVHQYLKSYTSKDGIHRNDRYLINTHHCVSFNYPDATDRFYRVNYYETSFGQENEIARLYNAYQKTLEKHQGSDIILWGLSRGASNLCIFAGVYQLENVKAIVLESPYYTMGEVIASIMKKKNLDRWLPLSYGETVAEFIFKKYTRYGYSPANCIENISKNIPIFIVCSEEDHLVPCSSSINVYKKLVETGNKDVYLFVTKHGKHAAILQGPEGENYQYVLNAFYKKYNLPYVASDAEKGEPLLKLCQPQF
jgi:hypothetical protein